MERRAKRKARKMILAIDPGTEKSGYVILNGMEILSSGIVDNENMLDILDVYKEVKNVELVVEMVASYGMAVGKTVFETCVWIGRFIERFSGPYNKIFRRQTSTNGVSGVCMTLCHNNRAKDKNIRAAIIDLYEPTGGGKIKQIGTKKQPGPLYGISGHMWSALAVGLTYFLSKK